MSGQGKFAAGSNHLRLNRDRVDRINRLAGIERFWFSWSKMGSATIAK
jgi:hypothetical protein